MFRGNHWFDFMHEDLSKKDTLLDTEGINRKIYFLLIFDLQHW